MKNLIPHDHLPAYLNKFNLHQTPKLNEKIEIIKEWVEMLSIGRVSAEKEESLKPQFINDFFGELLGYNHGNSSFYMLRLEQKSSTDATKADAALGFFRLNDSEILPEVHAVIEIKGFDQELDQKQRRFGTAIDQAFLYASKTSNPCKWVIVSNFKVIRFYYYQTGQSRYQEYHVTDLLDHKKLKELIFLFHKDYLISKGQSPTERLLQKANKKNTNIDVADHILDEIYHAIKKFEQFGFVDPRLIANIYPFNILDEYVWHYERTELFTINPKIYDLLQHIQVEDSTIKISEPLKAELEASVIDSQHKLEFILHFLNRSLIYKVSAIRKYKEIEKRNKSALGFSIRHPFSFSESEGMSREILISKDTECTCLSCTFRKLDIANFLSRVKSAFGNIHYDTLEYAYGNYLISSEDYKRTYQILRNLENKHKNKAGHEVEYFLVKLNLKYLHNLILDYDLADRAEILKYIRAIDIDRIISNEVEIHIDEEVRLYLIEIKEGKLIRDVEKQVDLLVDQIIETRKLLSNGGRGGQSDIEGLHYQYMLLYYYINRNFLIYDIFSDYKSIFEKVFEGLVNSYLTKGIGLEKFNCFYLIEATIHLSQQKLNKLLKEIETIELSIKDFEEYLERVNSFLNSFFKPGFFNRPYRSTIIQEILSNYSFIWKIGDLFGNTMLILSKLKLEESNVQKLYTSILGYLKTEDELSHWNIKEFGNLLRKKGDLFQIQQLVEIVHFAFENDRQGFNKYNDLIRLVPESIEVYYPEYKISNKKILMTAIANSYSSEGKPHLGHLIPLYKILDDELKLILIEEFDSVLTNSFNGTLYDLLIRNRVFDINRNKYFEIFIDQINKTKGRGYTGNSTRPFEDVTFYNFAILIYYLKVDFRDKRLQKVAYSSKFEYWLLNPDKFDYKEFKVEWLKPVKNRYILERLKAFPIIKSYIESYLESDYDQELAELYFKYFKKK